jgi:hypothetical protein
MGAAGHGTEHVTDYESNSPLMTTDNPILRRPLEQAKIAEANPTTNLELTIRRLATSGAQMDLLVPFSPRKCHLSVAEPYPLP